MLTLSANPYLRFLQLVLFAGLISAMLVAQEAPEDSSGESDDVAAESAATSNPASETAAVDEPASAMEQRSAPAKVVVIPVRDQIAKPILYVIRRGLKDAIESEADFVVLDMDTPGGSLGATFEILEALGKFDGATATYVNDEAISAGSFISAMTDDIYFAPQGVIGAAAPVMSGGGEIDESMKQKIVSYLKARIRAISEGHPYRGEVISAMIDADYELKIGDEVLKEKGELLSLTATEAAETYGDPPHPLLAAGIHDSVEDLLVARFGEGGYEITKLETTWSEELAAFLNGLTPILLGLGLLGMFIEFKTPGFGIFGIGGGILLMIVFFGHYTAGLSGHEPALFFVLGAVLVMVELLFLPGTIFVALAGIMSMLGALIWSMADLWPEEPISFSGDVFLGPGEDVAIDNGEIGEVPDRQCAGVVVAPVDAGGSRGIRAHSIREANALLRQKNLGIGIARSATVDRDMNALEWVRAAHRPVTAGRQRRPGAHEVGPGVLPACAPLPEEGNGEFGHLRFIACP